MSHGRRVAPADWSRLRTGFAEPTDPRCVAVRHGSRSAYDDWGCFCPEAREAIREVWRRRRVRGTGTASLSRSRDVDPVAVERAVRGDRVPLTVAERTAAVVRLTAAGRSANEIAAQLGIASRIVTRHRAKAREVA